MYLTHLTLDIDLVARLNFLSFAFCAFLLCLVHFRFVLKFNFVLQTGFRIGICSAIENFCK